MNLLSISMIKYIFFFAFLCELLVVGCALKGSGVPLEPDLDLYEVAFRDQFKRMSRTTEVVFISLGYDSTGKRWIDPPAGFVDRFKDLPWIGGVASEARLPEDGEMVSVQGFRHVEEKGSKRPALIYYIEVKGQTGKEIILKAGVYGAPRYGWGYELRATRNNGKWKVEDTGHGTWIS